MRVLAEQANDVSTAVMDGKKELLEGGGGSGRQDDTPSTMKAPLQRAPQPTRREPPREIPPTTAHTARAHPMGIDMSHHSKKSKSD